MTIIRWIIGRLILALDFLTRPSPINRAQNEQDMIDALTSNFSLYQFNACPFCVKVRRQIRKHGLKIELRDAKNNPLYKEELTQEGGKHKVPCLRIENADKNVTWLYNSRDINTFLATEFGVS